MAKFDRAGFLQYLREHTTLLESSISVYGRVMQNYFDEHGKISIQRINIYIAKHNTQANSIHIKAPFFHYFKFVGIPTMHLKRIRKLRKMPKKKHGNYLPEAIMLKLIGSIERPVFRDISLLRYYTGIRSFDALTIKEENITKESVTFNGETKNVIKILITAKGGKNRQIYLTYEKAAEILKPYIRKKPGFLFLPREVGDIESLDRAGFWRKLQTYERYYYTALQKAAKAIGLNKAFGTHDIRRIFIDRSRLKHNDMHLTKRLAGHSRIETTEVYYSNKDEEYINGMLGMQQ